MLMQNLNNITNKLNLIDVYEFWLPKIENITSFPNAHRISTVVMVIQENVTQS